MYTYKNMFEKLEIKYNASICLRDYDNIKLLSSKDYGMKFIKFTRKENFYEFCHNDIIRTIVNDCY